MVYKRIRGSISGRRLHVLNFVKYPTPLPGWEVGPSSPESSAGLTGIPFFSGRVDQTRESGRNLAYVEWDMND